jgi:hypothetical protein
LAARQLTSFAESRAFFFFLNFQDSVELEKNTPLTKKKKDTSENTDFNSYKNMI